MQESVINRSVVKVDQHFSLYRTYQLFRTLGLRHLLVTDKNNRVVGMITRRNLMTFNMEVRIEELLREADDDGSKTADDSCDVLPAVTLRMKHDSITEEDEDSITVQAAANGRVRKGNATTKF